MSIPSCLCRLLCGTELPLVLTGLVLAGCSTLSNSLTPQAPTVLKARLLTLSPETFTAVTLGPARGKPALLKPIVTTQHISATTGGALALSWAIPSGGTFAYSVTVPPGALSQDTEISIRVPNDHEAVVELLPHGIQFGAPVTFEIRVDVTANPNLGDIDQATLDTYWYNNILDMWQGQQATVQKTGSVINAVAQLQHFSRYALGGDRDHGRGGRKGRGL